MIFSGTVYFPERAYPARLGRSYNGKKYTNYYKIASLFQSEVIVSKVDFEVTSGYNYRRFLMWNYFSDEKSYRFSVWRNYSLGQPVFWA